MDHRTPSSPLAEPPPGRPRRRGLLALLALAQLMVILDISAVNVALPDLARDLRLGPTELSWTITSYSVVFGSLLLLGGRAADLLGRRRMFLTGLAVFTVASAASAVAGGAASLFAARAGQGDRRGDAVPRGTVNHHRLVRPRARAHAGARRVGGGRRRGRGDRRPRWRHPHPARRLARDLPHQPPDRTVRRRADPGHRASGHAPAALARGRSPGGAGGDVERRGDRLLALAGAIGGVALRTDARRRCGGTRRPAPVRDLRGPRLTPAPQRPAVGRPGGRRRVCDDARGRRRPVRLVPAHLAVPPDRARRQRARDRARVPALCARHRAAGCMPGRTPSTTTGRRSRSRSASL